MFRIFIFILLISPVSAWAADAEFTLNIIEHRFHPESLVVPANKKIRLTVNNRDATPEEFESKDLKREKIIPAKSSAVILLGPLAPGKYKFVGEFNEKTAKGVIVAE